MQEINNRKCWLMTIYTPQCVGENCNLIAPPTRPSSAKCSKNFLCTANVWLSEFEFTPCKWTCQSCFVWNCVQEPFLQFSTRHGVTTTATTPSVFVLLLSEPSTVCLLVSVGRWCCFVVTVFEKDAFYTEWPKKMYTLFTHQYLWNKCKWNFYFRARE